MDDFEIVREALINWIDGPKEYAEALMAIDRIKEHMQQLEQEHEGDDATYYRKILTEGFNFICAATDVYVDYYDRDQAEGECYLDCFRDAADLLRKAGVKWDQEEHDFVVPVEQERRWIPVEERLPDDPFQIVLVAVGVARCSGGVWFSMTGDDSHRPIRWKVTHWAPLPPAPGSEESEQ